MLDPYKIHLNRSDYETSDSGNSDFDEEYLKYQPPPILIPPQNVITIEAVIPQNVTAKKKSKKKAEKINENVPGKHLSSNSTKEKKDAVGLRKDIFTENQFDILASSEDENIQPIINEIDENCSDKADNHLKKLEVEILDTTYETETFLFQKKKHRRRKSKEQIDQTNDSVRSTKRDKSDINVDMVQNYVKFSNNKGNYKKTLPVETNTYISIKKNNGKKPKKLTIQQKPKDKDNIKTLITSLKKKYDTSSEVSINKMKLKMKKNDNLEIEKDQTKKQALPQIMNQMVPTSIYPEYQQNLSYADILQNNTSSSNHKWLKYNANIFAEKTVSCVFDDDTDTSTTPIEIMKKSPKKRKTKKKNKKKLISNEVNLSVIASRDQTFILPHMENTDTLLSCSPTDKYFTTKSDIINIEEVETPQTSDQIIQQAINQRETIFNYREAEHIHQLCYPELIQKYLFENKLLDHKNNYEIVTETYSFNNPILEKPNQFYADDGISNYCFKTTSNQISTEMFQKKTKKKNKVPICHYENLVVASRDQINIPCTEDDDPFITQYDAANSHQGEDFENFTNPFFKDETIQNKLELKFGTYSTDFDLFSNQDRRFQSIIEVEQEEISVINQKVTSSIDRGWEPILNEKLMQTYLSNHNIHQYRRNSDGLVTKGYSINTQLLEKPNQFYDDEDISNYSKTISNQISTEKLQKKKKNKQKNKKVPICDYENLDVASRDQIIIPRTEDAGNGWEPVENLNEKLSNFKTTSNKTSTGLSQKKKKNERNKKASRDQIIIPCTENAGNEREPVPNLNEKLLNSKTTSYQTSTGMLQKKNKNNKNKKVLTCDNTILVVASKDQIISPCTEEDGNEWEPVNNLYEKLLNSETSSNQTGMYTNLVGASRDQMIIPCTEDAGNEWQPIANLNEKLLNSKTTPNQTSTGTLHKKKKNEKNKNAQIHQIIIPCSENAGKEWEPVPNLNEKLLNSKTSSNQTGTLQKKKKVKKVPICDYTNLVVASRDQIIIPCTEDAGNEWEPVANLNEKLLNSKATPNQTSTGTLQKKKKNEKNKKATSDQIIIPCTENAGNEWEPVSNLNEKLLNFKTTSNQTSTGTLQKKNKNNKKNKKVPICDNTNLVVPSRDQIVIPCTEDDGNDWESISNLNEKLLNSKTISNQAETLQNKTRNKNEPICDNENLVVTSRDEIIIPCPKDTDPLEIEQEEKSVINQNETSSVDLETFLPIHNILQYLRKSDELLTEGYSFNNPSLGTSDDFHVDGTNYFRTDSTQTPLLNQNQNKKSQENKTQTIHDVQNWYKDVSKYSDIYQATSSKDEPENFSIIQTQPEIEYPWNPVRNYPTDCFANNSSVDRQIQSVSNRKNANFLKKECHEDRTIMEISQKNHRMEQESTSSILEDEFETVTNISGANKRIQIEVEDEVKYFPKHPSILTRCLKSISKIQLTIISGFLICLIYLYKRKDF